MSRNGSGQYSLPVNTWNQATNGVSASASDYQALINDIATALTGSVASDGQTPMSGSLAMGNNRLTGLAAGTAAGHSVRWEQLFSQGVEADIASATTTDIGAQNTNFLQVTGTTTITGFGANYNGPRFLRFAGALTLTHGSALILPGAANITTAANDRAIAIPKATSGTPDGWIVFYQRAAGLPAMAGANTDITSLASPALGSATATTQSANDNSTKVATTAYADRLGVKIPNLTVTMVSNAILIQVAELTLDFRSTTLGSGVITTVTDEPADLTISAGSTLGTVNGVQSRLAVLVMNNAGTMETAVVNLAGGTDLSETGLISTTAEGGAGAADSANVVYSASARSNLAYRVIGYIESTQATAGTWATDASTVQGVGGEAFTAMSSIGYGQAWQSVTRNNGTTYYNATGKPIVFMVTAVGVTAANNYPTITVTQNGVSVIAGAGSAVAATNNSTATAIIPPGASYSWTIAGGSTSNLAVELR